MKRIELEKVNSNLNNAFTFERYEDKYFRHQIHYHPEMEIILIVEGEGNCIVTDGMLPFETGDLFFFESNMPHWFKNDDIYYDSNHLKSKSLYIQFTERILPQDYVAMPGCINIKELIQEGKKGLKWKTGINEDMTIMIKDMEQVDGFERLHLLYKLLNTMGVKVKEGKQIGSSAYTASKDSTDLAYQRVINYINQNFSKDITISALAEYAHMNPSALCRYFKKKGGQPIFKHLLDVRIAYAKLQLAYTDAHISDIAYDSGFNSVPNFNAQFKRVSRITPSEYRKKLK